MAPSHPNGVQREHALDLMFSARGGAVVPVVDRDTSMVPHLRGGDAVWVVPLARAPRRGEIILYNQQDYWVVHRCLGDVPAADGGSAFRTRGDGRNELDPRLGLKDVKGRVTALRRNGAWSSLEGAPARGYARLIAWHDLAWAAAGVVAHKVGVGKVVAALDRLVLNLAVPIAFPLFHRRIDPPGDGGAV